MHLIDFRKKVGALGLREIARGLVKVFLATLVMAATVWVMRRFLVLWPGHEGNMFGVLRLGAHILTGLVVYVLSGIAMRMEEFKELMEALRKRRNRPPKPLPPSESFLDPGDAET